MYIFRILFFSLFGVFFIEKVHLIIGYKTSQGNRKKCIFYFVNYYSFCKQMRIHFCACSQFLKPHSPEPSTGRSIFFSLLFKTKYEIFFACRRHCSSFCVASCGFCMLCSVSVFVSFYFVSYILLLLLQFQNGEFLWHVMTGGAICKEYEMK